MPSGIQQSQILFIKTKFKLFTQKQRSGSIIWLRAHVYLLDVELLKLTRISSNEKGWLCTFKHRSKMTKYKRIRMSSCIKLSSIWSTMKPETILASTKHSESRGEKPMWNKTTQGRECGSHKTHCTTVQSLHSPETKSLAAHHFWANRIHFTMFSN